MREKSVVPALTTQLLMKALIACGSRSTSRHESSVGSNCTNGMKALSWNVSVSVLTEFIAAQRKGTRVKIEAAVKSA